MSQWSESKPPPMEDVSSLMDGEADVSATGRACAQWRDDAATRAQWHAYHLIGDVLRSEDLIPDPGHDAAFLAAFRERLAQEPVILAPSLRTFMPVQQVRRRSWATPAAVAAGFVAVAGVLVVTQMSGSVGLPQADASLAKAPAVLPAAVLVSGAAASGSAAEPPVMVLNGRLIRDVRLDEYLAAHKKFGGSSAPGGPSGFLRNAAADGTAAR